MNQSTQEIHNILTNPQINELYQKLVNEHHELYLQGTDMAKAHEIFKKCVTKIINSINNTVTSEANQTKSVFESIDSAKAYTITIHINSIVKRLFNSQEDINDKPANALNIISDTIKLQDSTEEIDNFIADIKLIELRNKGTVIYNQTNTNNTIEVSNDDIDHLKNEYSQLQKEIQDLVQQKNESAILLKDVLQEAQMVQDTIRNIESNKDKAKNAQEEIEERRLKFNTNLNEYTSRIDELEQKAKEIIAKEETVNTLISEARTALQLKSAEGVSAAFAQQYEDIKKQNKLWILNLWLIGAMLFALGAISVTIWIAISQSGINGNHSTEKLVAIPTEYWVSMLVARITAVAISLAGATFCAKQYIKQQNIAEDYAYKAVLAKSIVAFTEEIKSHNPDKAGEYLTKVLDEIHKDPLRGRDTKEDSNIGIDVWELLKSLVDKLPPNNPK